ncbi:hypothetical protein Baya_4481 [Bagarius yarrelli]|uniref:Uncharacterized protein n=1 Tax=Bagarius yarrelli TaxID=175774 RepID=A0A556TQA3_BAGYA|nr:hypothetical protein Baya_4481 [Bagarius yarrelli]
MVADIVKNEESSPPRAEAQTYYSTNNSWIYDAFQPMEGIEIGSREQSDQSFNMSSSDSSQLDPAFAQCHGLSGDGNQHYDPESTFAGNGDLDLKAQEGCRTLEGLENQAELGAMAELTYNPDQSSS